MITSRDGVLSLLQGTFFVVPVLRTLSTYFFLVLSRKICGTTFFIMTVGREFYSQQWGIV